MHTLSLGTISYTYPTHNEIRSQFFHPDIFLSIYIWNLAVPIYIIYNSKNCTDCNNLIRSENKEIISVNFLYLVKIYDHFSFSGQAAIYAFLKRYSLPSLASQGKQQL